MSTGFGLAEPPSRAGAADVTGLAESALLGYYQGGDLYRAVAELGEVESAEIRIFVRSSTFRLGLAALGAIQLAVDAAAVAVEYTEQREYAGGEIDADYLASLAFDAAFDLEIVELNQGSIFARLKLVKKKDVRASVLGVLTIASLLIIPLVGPVPSLVLAGVTAANEVIPDRQVERLQKQVNELSEKVAAQEALIHDELLRRTEGLQTVSPQQAAAAEVESVRADVVPAAT